MREVFADLADVTLAGENTKSILTDNVNRVIQGNVQGVFFNWASPKGRPSPKSC